MLLLAACQAQAPIATAPEATPPPQPTGVPPTTVVPSATPLAPAPVQPTQAPLTSPLPTEALSAPPTQAQALPTPVCDANVRVTPAMTEGPYYKPNTPERTSLLEPGMAGTKIIITGYVLTADCQPIPGAWLDFWQADANGAYDNVGYRLRGHQFTDAAGRYILETVVPGLYPGRTSHIHVKVQAPNGPVLTTQLFFPKEPSNQNDRIFSPDLLLAVQNTAGGQVATFNFVLDVR